MHAICKKYPALFCALLLYVATLTALGETAAIAFGALIFCFFASFRKKLALFALLLSLLFGLYLHTHILLPVEEYSTGDAEVTFTSVKEAGRTARYSGTLHSFRDEKGTLIAKNIPVTTTFPKNKGPLLGEKNKVEGVLQAAKQRAYLKLPPMQAKTPPSSSRQRLKKEMKRRIETQVADPRAAAFLTGLSTGEYAHQELQQELSRFGLQHIMAISGFHFALIAAIATTLLHFFVPPTVARPTAALLLTSYFIFLGWSPSIFRAWVMAVVFLSSTLFLRRSEALNALGVAGCASILHSPLSVLQLGFTFSFGITLTILLLYTPMEKALRLLIPLRRFETLKRAERFEQCGYLLLQWIRCALALAFSVSIFCIPFSLSYFHSYPLHGFLMNILFPTATSLLMLMLLPALLIPQLLPFVGWYAAKLLDLVYNTPLSAEYWLRSAALPMIASSCLLFFLLSSALILTNIELRTYTLSFLRRS